MTKKRSWSSLFVFYYFLVSLALEMNMNIVGALKLLVTVVAAERVAFVSYCVDVAAGKNVLCKTLVAVADCVTNDTNAGESLLVVLELASLEWLIRMG